MSILFVEGVGTFCKRYGPGRLPGASRPAVGAAYAVATAAVAAAVAFIVLTGVQTLLFTLMFGRPFAVTGELTYFGLLAIPLVVPVAFVGGAVAWRLLPESMSYRGALVGVLATVLTYVGATLLVAPIILIAITPSEPIGAVIIGLLVGINGFLFTFWFTLPIGAVSGWIHERAVTEH